MQAKKQKDTFARLPAHTFTHRRLNEKHTLLGMSSYRCIPKRLKSERGSVKYKNSWLLGYGLCFESKLKKETFGCFPLLGILKGAADKAVSHYTGQEKLPEKWLNNNLLQKIPLPLLIFPKPENKLCTKERFWDTKLNSCDVISEQSQQRAS